MVAVTSFGCSRLELLGDLLGHRRGRRRSRAAAAGGRRGASPCCRWSPAGRRACARPACRGPAARPGSTRGARRPRPGRGRSRAGRRRAACPAWSTVHWWTWSSRAARLAAQVRVARSSMIGKTRRSPCRLSPRDPVVGHVGGAHPARRTGRGVLLEEAVALDAVRPPDAGDRAVLQQRQQHRRDLGVVVEHLALGGAGARVEDLVEVGELEGAALDLDPDLLSRRLIGVIATDRHDRDLASGSRRHISLPQERARGADAAGGGAAAVDVQEDPGAAVAHLARGCSSVTIEILVLHREVAQPLGAVLVARRQPPAEPALRPCCGSGCSSASRCPRPSSRRCWMRR